MCMRDRSAGDLDDVLVGQVEEDGCVGCLVSWTKVQCGVFEHPNSIALDVPGISGERLHHDEPYALTASYTHLRAHQIP